LGSIHDLEWVAISGKGDIPRPKISVRTSSMTLGKRTHSSNRPTSRILTTLRYVSVRKNSGAHG